MPLLNVFLFLITVGGFLHQNMMKDCITEIPYTINATMTTLNTKRQVNMDLICKSAYWWKLKLMFFQSLVIPTYLASKIWYIGRSELTTTTLTLLYPIIPYFTELIYWLDIWFLMTCITTIDTIRIVAWTLRGTDHDKTKKHKFKWKQHNNTIGALPESRMVLSTIWLKQEFVEWLSKMGIYFLGFMDSMHKIGINVVIFTMPLSLSSLNIT